MIPIPKGKRSHSVNVNGNWAYLAEKTSKPGAKITTIFRLS